MFKVTRSAENRLDVEIAGKMSSDEMTVALDEFVNAAEGIEKGKLMYKIHDFHFPSLGAMGVKLSRLPSLFGLIRKFDRMVLMTDAEWLKRASELEGILVPSLEVKAFSLDQELEAEIWLNRK